MPFIVVTLFYSVPLKYISGYYSNSGNIFKDVVVGQVLVQGNTHLWFLPVLFVIFIIIYALEKTLRNSAGGGIALSLFVASYASVFIPIGIVSNALYYALWFYAGYRFEDYRENINANLKKRPRIIILFIIVFLCSGLLRKLLSDWAETLPICSVLERCVRYICAVFGCGLVYSISYFLSKTNITKWRLFKVIRTNTLGLYLYSDTWNYIILNIATTLFGSTVFVTNTGSALIYFSRIAITFSIALAVSMVLKKIKVKYIC